MRLYNRMMIVVAMFMSQFRCVGVQEVLKLETRIFSKAYFDRQKFSQIINNFFSSMFLFNEPDSFTYTLNESGLGYIIKNTDNKFELYEYDKSTLLFNILFAARGTVSENKHVCVLHNQDRTKTCIIEVRREKDPVNGQQDYYFVIDIFEKKPISQDIKAQIRRIDGMADAATKEKAIHELIHSMKFINPYDGDQPRDIQREEERPEPLPTFLSTMHTSTRPKKAIFSVVYTNDGKRCDIKAGYNALFELIKISINSDPKYNEGGRLLEYVSDDPENPHYITATIVFNGDHFRVTPGYVSAYPDTGFAEADTEARYREVRQEFNQLTERSKKLREKRQGMRQESARSPEPRILEIDTNELEAQSSAIRELILKYKAILDNLLILKHESVLPPLPAELR